MRGIVELGCWLLIIALAVLVVLGPRGRPEGPGDDAEERLAVDPELRFRAQVAVAARELPGEEGARQAEAQLDQLGRDLDAPLQRLHLSVLIGELRGAESALLQLEDFEREGLLDDERLVEDLAALRRLYAEGPGALAADERARLVAVHGWFGRLALVHGAEGIDREELIRGAVRKSAFASATMMLVLALLLGGAFCASALWRRWRRGELHPAFRPEAGDRIPLLVSFTAYLLLLIAFSAMLGALGLSGELSAHWLLWPPLAVALWLLLRGAGWSFARMRERLGLHAGAGVGREMVAGLVGYCAGLPLIALSLLISLLLLWLQGPGAEAPHHPVQDVAELADGPVAWLLLVSITVLWAPLTEETLFRGALFGALRTRFPGLLAALLSALVFAALHPQGLLLVPVLASIGVVMALLREWRSSVIAGITAHALHNGLVTWGSYLYYG